MRAVPASTLSLDRLVDTWNSAYAGYFVPMSWDVAQLRRHIEAGSIDLDRSLVWLEGNDPVALSLLGIRPALAPATPPAHSTQKSSAHNPSRGTGDSKAESGHSTEGGTSSGQDLRGWIGGFGIAPSHRGRGLATVLMSDQLDVARESGVRRVQLEVLTQNWAARSYERAGFVSTRRLSVLHGQLKRPPVGGDEVTNAVWRCAGDVPDLGVQLERLHALCPAAWTREHAALRGQLGGLELLSLGERDEMAAALLVREQGGALAVAAAGATNEASAHQLAAALAVRNDGRECRVVNEPDDSPLLHAFAAAGLVEVLAQYEMHWTA